jgi:hypothetical protein
MKRYKLLKDLPDHKRGTIFVYDNVRHKYKTEMEAINACDPYSCYMAKYVENNPTFFEEVKEERIEVIQVTYSKQNDYFGNKAVWVSTNQQITEDKFPKIKKALESILNNEENFYRELIGIDLKYTEQDILKTEEKAFNAAREKDYTKWSNYKYDTFSDYKNQTTKQ